MPRTLRARLVAGVLVLLALACTAVGFASTIALERFMVNRVDQQLSMAAGRFAASLEHEPEEGQERSEGQEHGDSRGQAVGTLGARLYNGKVTHAAVVVTEGREVELSAVDAAVLATLPVDRLGHTVTLEGLGVYRVMAAHGLDGDVLVDGLPLRSVHETIERLNVIEAMVFAAALIATWLAGTLWVRLSLRPLGRVTATARRVAELPLASGEVALPERVPEEDPRTEIGQVGVAINRMLGHVEDALARRQASEQRMRTFAADASHELRTPIAAVRAHAELARHVPGPIPGDVRHALARIEAESARMGTLVDDLLLLARLDAGRPLAREEVDLSRIVIDLVGDMRVAGPGHRWRLELPEEPVIVTGDADRLHQVIANLLGNARTHTPEGCTITAALRVTGSGATNAPSDGGPNPGSPDGKRTDESDRADPSSGEVELTVRDDGPGIPESLRPEIFERFTRADKARSRASGGSGLGLSIVRAVVAAHGGTVDLESRPGQTTFRVRLPSA